MDYYQQRIDYFMGQQYHVIKRDLIESGKLFEDSHFPANNDSLFTKELGQIGIVWKRPKDLVRDPRLVSDKKVRLDLKPGEYGSVSVVAAFSVLSNHPDLFKRVVIDIPSQEWNQQKSHEYVGLFRFRFWHFGKWIEVVIDDRLPFNVKKNVLCGISSNDRREFWPALLEKAYAKLLGCYEALLTNNTGNILQSLTGGIIQSVSLKKLKEKQKSSLFNDLYETPTMGKTLICCWIATSRKNGRGVTNDGLLIGYVYVVSAVRESSLRTGLISWFNNDRVRLLKLTDPIDPVEWSGSWSKESNEWKQLSAGDKRKMGLATNNNNEFWMSFDDFCTHFTDLTLCRIIHSTSITGNYWREQHVFGSWVFHDDPELNTTGGSFEKHPKTFLQNPQYRFDITEKSGKEKLFIQLQQKEPRKTAYSTNFPNLSIGFYIIKVELNRVFKLHSMISIGTSYPYSTGRNAFAKVKLAKGRYVILPTTLNSKKHGDFLLQLYSQKNINFQDMNLTYPEKTCWAFCIGYPVLATSITVIDGKHLDQLTSKGANVFVVISCEGEHIESQTFRNSANPIKFDTSAIYYRKNINSPITISVFRTGCLFDSFLGQAVSEGSVDDSGTNIEKPLYGRGKLFDKQYPGTLTIKIKTVDFIHAL